MAEAIRDMVAAECLKSEIDAVLSEIRSDWLGYVETFEIMTESEFDALLQILKEKQI